MAEWLDEILLDNSCYPCKIRDIDKCGYSEKDFDSRCQLCAKNRKLWLNSEVENEFIFSFGALCPKFSTQLKQQGYELKTKKMG